VQFKHPVGSFSILPRSLDVRARTLRDAA
jgi:hypothetical protein